MEIEYSLVDPDGKGFHEDHWAVRVDNTELKGYTFQYDTVKIIEQDNPEDGAILEFNTITLKEPLLENDLTDEELKNILGDILVDILKTQIEHKDENGTPDTESPTE